VSRSMSAVETVSQNLAFSLRRFGRSQTDGFELTSREAEILGFSFQGYKVETVQTQRDLQSLSFASEQ